MKNSNALTMQKHLPENPFCNCSSCFKLREAKSLVTLIENISARVFLEKNTAITDAKNSSILRNEKFESNIPIPIIKEESSHQEPIRSVIPFKQADIVERLHKELISIEYRFLEPCSPELFKSHCIKDFAPALEKLKCLASRKDLVYIFHRFSMYNAIEAMNNLPYTLTQHFVYKNPKTGKESFLIERNLMSTRTTIIKELREKKYNLELEKLIKKVLGL